MTISRISNSSFSLMAVDSVTTPRTETSSISTEYAFSPATLDSPRKRGFSTEEEDVFHEITTQKVSLRRVIVPIQASFFEQAERISNALRNLKFPIPIQLKTGVVYIKDSVREYGDIHLSYYDQWLVNLEENDLRITQCFIKVLKKSTRLKSAKKINSIMKEELKQYQELKKFSERNPVFKLASYYDLDEVENELYQRDLNAQSSSMESLQHFHFKRRAFDKQDVSESKTFETNSISAKTDSTSCFSTNSESSIASALAQSLKRTGCHLVEYIETSTNDAFVKENSEIISKLFDITIKHNPSHIIDSRTNNICIINNDMMNLCYVSLQNAFNPMTEEKKVSDDSVDDLADFLEDSLTF